MLRYLTTNKWQNCARISIAFTIIWCIVYFLNVGSLITSNTGAVEDIPLKPFTNSANNYESDAEHSSSPDNDIIFEQVEDDAVKDESEESRNDNSISDMILKHSNNETESSSYEINTQNSDAEYDAVPRPNLSEISKDSSPDIQSEESQKTTVTAKFGLGLLQQLIHGYKLDTQGAGEMGKAYSVTNNTETERRFKENEFNVVVSEHISLNRSLPIISSSKCREIAYPGQLPTCSVVIVFYNEAWSTLLRSVHSVLNRSPAHLLKEIILIDDASEQEHLKEPLEQYLKIFTPKVRMKRLSVRSGLMAARLEGAKMAQGDVLIFLDAHIETTPRWLEPLLSRIKEDRTVVVSPMIDIIDENTFAYVPTAQLAWGGFTWALNFRWYWEKSVLLRDRKPTDTYSPYKTPTIAGGLFAIDRQYFWDVGSYDEEMKIWGGENMEISFRVWMCGGSLEIHPCSRVGHVFRDSPPYQHGNHTFMSGTYNAARVAEVWLDEYKIFFYAMKPEMDPSFAGDVSRRRALRQKLGCKSFRWYLENVIPEGNIPVSFYSLGTIMNDQSQTCISKTNREHTPPILHPCNGKNYRQIWSYTSEYQIRNDEQYLGFDNSDVYVKRDEFARDKWNYDRQNKWLRHNKSGQCLTANEQFIVMQPCQPGLLTQSWTINEYDGQLRPKQVLSSPTSTIGVAKAKVNLDSA